MKWVAAVAGQKAKRGKMVKRESVTVGSAAAYKKKPVDITNLNQQQQQEPVTQQAKQQPTLPAASAPNSQCMLLMNCIFGLRDVLFLCAYMADGYLNLFLRKMQC